MPETPETPEKPTPPAKGKGKSQTKAQILASAKKELGLEFAPERLEHATKADVAQWVEDARKAQADRAKEKDRVGPGRGPERSHPHRDAYVPIDTSPDAEGENTCANCIEPAVWKSEGRVASVVRLCATHKPAE